MLEIQTDSYTQKHNTLRELKEMNLIHFSIMNKHKHIKRTTITTNKQKTKKKFIKHKVNGLILQMLLLLLLLLLLFILWVLYYDLLLFLVFTKWPLTACLLSYHACIHACLHQRIMKMKLSFLIQQR